MTKIALITGASSGIGGAAAVSLANRGVDSILTYNSNPDGLSEVIQEVQRRGATAVPLRLDVGRCETFTSFREEVSATLSRQWSARAFDYLVNNAGLARMAVFADTTEEHFDECLRVLFKGPYFLTQALLPLLADGGAIVNTSSSSALPWGTEVGYSAYASMKGGLDVLTRYLAKELSSRRIRANSVAPGPTRTRLGGDAFEKYPEVIAPLVERTALGRLGEPGDVGDVIAALLSDECRWVTGQNIEVSGGFKL